MITTVDKASSCKGPRVVLSEEDLAILLNLVAVVGEATKDREAAEYGLRVLAAMEQDLTERTYEAPGYL